MRSFSARRGFLGAGAAAAGATGLGASDMVSSSSRARVLWTQALCRAG
ncbi:MAG: twin-arginine translocation signal domain-containing protein [Planctomycetes bacterium]|nr:twin-arginine translocation signal domain-containing protein [Planctomycetota bacterium]